MSLAAIALVLNLFEFYYEVSSDVPSCLMAHLREHKLALFAHSWLHLNLLHGANWVHGLRVVAHHVAIVVHRLHRAAVEFFQRAVDSENDVSWLGRLRLGETSEGIREDTLLHVGAIHLAGLKEELSIGQNSLEVALRLLLEEVTAADFLSIWGSDALLKAVLAIYVVDSLLVHCEAITKDKLSKL